MQPDRWRRVEQVLDAALSRNPSEWESLLDERCSTDPELRREVEALLGRVSTARQFLDSPPVNVAAALVSDARSEAESPSQEGRRVGAYRVVREVGRGGMSRVYLAERADGQFTQHVALKLLRPGLDSDIDVERFRVERQILATLNHPHIARVFDGGLTDDGLPYLVLEFVDGKPIDRYCDELHLTIRERLALFRIVTDATQYAHRNLVVHRDLKPSNILVTADGTVKLLDFGLAKLLDADASAAAPLTQTAHRWMTPEYAAPEQILGGRVTTLTDVYQLGAVLYELLTGTPPFGRRGGTMRELEDAVLQSNPLGPSTANKSVHGDLDAIVLKSLRKEPERRYVSAAALGEDLDRLRDGQPVVARPDNAVYRLRKFVGRHRAGVLASAGLAMLVVGAAIRERTLRSRAEEQTRTAKAVESYLVSVFSVSDPYSPEAPRNTDVTARALLDVGASRVDSALATDPLIQSELRGVFGQVYSNLGLIDKAAEQQRRAFEQRRRMLGARDPAVAETMDALGVTLGQQDKFDEAERLLRGALEIRRTALGTNDSATAQSMSHLAAMQQRRNKYAEAESLFRAALAARRAQSGDGSLAVATSLNDVGLLLVQQGKFDAAVPLYQQALAIDSRRLGAQHTVTAQVLANLAEAEGSQGKYDDAERDYRAALAVERKSLGNAHPDVTTLMNNLGQMLSRYKNEYVESEALIREAIAGDRKTLGDNHNFVAEGLNNLGFIQRMRGDYDGAEQSYRQALRVNEAMFGAEHISIAANLNNIAIIKFAEGEADEAAALLRRAVAMYARALGDEHINTITVNNNLANALRDEGKLAEAEQLYRHALARLDSSKSRQRQEFIRINLGLGAIFLARGQVDSAKLAIDHMIEISTTQFGAANWRTAEAKLRVGRCLLAQHQYARAEPLLQDADSTLRKAKGIDRYLVDESKTAIRQVNAALGSRVGARN